MYSPVMINGRDGFLEVVPSMLQSRRAPIWDVFGGGETCLSEV